ncbi:MAG: DUF2797 domain-containing protein [Pseudomonadales bacterium]|nr:DUF2797 domain-containing protein [Pseudomonadales bacterium]
MILGSGAISKMHVEHKSPASYHLPLGDGLVAMNELIGHRIRLEFLSKISCAHCGRVTKKSYAGGYCFPCFKKLAQCDLCVMSPDRCHYAKGTCREPAWGEEFCMQPHVLYLANSTGLKVGITRTSQMPTRWLDQGAVQAIVLMRTATRYQVGCVEKCLAEFVSDKTNWRKLITGDSQKVDMQAAALALRSEAAENFTLLDEKFGADLVWEEASEVHEFQYPVERYLDKAKTQKLKPDEALEGVLTGIRGQYLLLDSGAFNVRSHTSHHVALSRL